MGGRTAASIVTYADGRVVRTIAIEHEASIDALVAAELVAHDESAEVVILDEDGHRLERWCRRGSRITREWSLPGVVARAPGVRRPSSNPPPPR